jgi:hypothetical protein
VGVPADFSGSGYACTVRWVSLSPVRYSLLVERVRVGEVRKPAKKKANGASLALGDSLALHICTWNGASQGIGLPT